jgi:hypothetical protein
MMEDSCNAGLTPKLNSEFAFALSALNLAAVPARLMSLAVL